MAKPSDVTGEKDVTSEELPDFVTRLRWPSGVVAEARVDEEDHVAIVFTNLDAKLAVTCRATATTIVCA